MRRTALASAAAVLVLVALAFFAGRSLGGKDHEALAFDLKAPSYDTAPPAAGLSQAGFSGAEEGTGTTGGVLVAGRAVSVSADVLTLSTASGPARFRISGNRSLRQITAGSPADIAPGATVVVVVLRPDGVEAQAVLVIAQP